MHLSHNLSLTIVQNNTGQNMVQSFSKINLINPCAIYFDVENLFLYKLKKFLIQLINKKYEKFL
ncbi:hypothetical protein BpHYR1_003338 [Brachionus plicatilis]|uniref:Uncharacterized protein n=1 Tax=Brachionus plicatilis TaxID=10195 RepID=A0A3M7R9A3_BRAPC|nr:hypothetical protein BpHYR1_003338 [Brachionus plicatilis]